MYPRILAEECRLFLAEFLRKKIISTNYSGGWSNLFKKQEFKTTTERKNLQAKKLRRRKKRSERERGQHRGRRWNIASQGLKEEYEITLNNAVRQSKRGPALERRRNTRLIGSWPEDNRTFQVKIRASPRRCWAAVQKGHMIEQEINVSAEKFTKQLTQRKRVVDSLIYRKD